MAGRTIRICPPRDFEFDGLDGNEIMTVTLAERIDCSQYDTAELIVRVVGALTTGTDPAKIDVLLVSDGFTPDDPSVDYFSDALTTVSFAYDQNGYAAGTLMVGSTSGDLGSMLAVQIKGTQAATKDMLSGRLAIELALKTSD